MHALWRGIVLVLAMACAAAAQTPIGPETARGAFIEARAASDHDGGKLIPPRARSSPTSPTVPACCARSFLQ